MIGSDKKTNYLNALEDFYAARGQAAIEEVVARIKGKNTRLLEYDEVRSRFRLIESATWTLKEIPLDAIVGSVNRHQDFTRSLLPLKRNDFERWARVKTMVVDLSGLPPIEVYQVGEVYFIIDGHHRASVARELGATYIQAYVRQVYTLVPLTPEDDLQDVIIKSEFAEFLSKTHFNELCPNAKLHVTISGVYQILLEHISVHQYFMGLDQRRDISFPEAVVHWYDHVYLPVVEVVRSRGLLRIFSDRTETDLYYYIMEYRSRSEQELGWKVTPRDAAENLVFNYARDIKHRYYRLRKKIINMLTPEPLEPALPPGFWRQHRRTHEENIRGLFDTILVAMPSNESNWNALDAALFVAKNEHAVVSGLTVVPDEKLVSHSIVEQFREKFLQHCQESGVEGRIAVEVGKVPSVIYERSFWVDLIVLRLAFPPPIKLLQRLGSGIRTLIRRSAAPLLFVPPNAPTAIHRVLLAYGGGRSADEALYMAAYLCIRFKIDLTVITVGRHSQESASLHQQARTYLEGMGIRIVNYIEEQGDEARAILQNCQAAECDLILMGGYEGSLLKEIINQNAVDRVLRSTNRMVMVCR